MIGEASGDDEVMMVSKSRGSVTNGGSGKDRTMEAVTIGASGEDTARWHTPKPAA